MKQIFLLAVCISLHFTITAQSAIKVEKKGDGTPVLFLPGFACPGAVWDSSIDQLQTEFEIHQVTYAGFDGLPPVKMPWYDALKNALTDYIKKERLSGIYIVGHSMGGTLAADIAATLPGICKKILLVDALPCMREIMMPGVAADQIQYESPYNKQMIDMTAEQLGNYAKMMSGNMSTDTAKAALIAQWMQQADRETFVYGYTDLLKLDLRDDLPQIKCPVTILSASWPNPDLFKQNYELQYAKLVNKEIKIAPSSRHFIMFDQPEWFYNELNSFLAK